jgi:predicted cytidylate kinase
MNSRHSKITLGGLSGTGKGTIVKLLAEKLGFEKVSVGNLLRDIAAERNITIVELDKLLHDSPEESFRIDKVVDMRTKEYGEKNKNFIIESRLGAHFVPDAFKILLLCDDRRYERIANREGISIEKAKQDTLSRESTYHRRYGTLYNLADFDDPKYYDLVIDTSDVTPEEILNKIIQKIT